MSGESSIHWAAAPSVAGHFEKALASIWAICGSGKCPSIAPGSDSVAAPWSSVLHRTIGLYPYTCTLMAADTIDCSQYAEGAPIAKLFSWDGGNIYLCFKSHPQRDGGHYAIDGPYPYGQIISGSHACVYLYRGDGDRYCAIYQVDYDHKTGRPSMIYRWVIG